jgi:CheY-like chemotaxis protein
VRVTFCGNVWWVAHAILICDDDPEIRGAMKRTGRGYDVTETAAPCEALDIELSRYGLGSS